MNARELNARGRSLLERGQHAQALASFRAAVQSDPRDAAAACNLGKVLLDLGDLTQAVTWLERAVDIEPTNGSFYYSLVTAAGGQLKPAHHAGLIELSEGSEGRPLAERIDLHFALGHVCERAGRIDAAFAHLSAGNALKRTQLAYDEGAQLTFLRASQEIFAQSVADRIGGCGDLSEQPIFIFGMPRSGSTLVEQLLAAHPAVECGGEIGLFGGIVREWWPSANGLTPATFRSGIRQIGERYLQAIAGLCSSGMRFTDKTPYNFCFAPLINATLPNARMIHTRRNALDTCLSCFATNFGGAAVPFSYDLGELGRYYTAYADMVDRWTTIVPPDRLLHVDYERLVDDFASEAQRILAFCGLDWDTACLNFHTVQRPVSTASNVQVRQPLYRSSVGRAERFRHHLGPLFDSVAR